MLAVTPHEKGTVIKTKAALLMGPHQGWEIRELELAEPRAGEVLVRLEVAGLCHSDEHAKYGSVPYPMVGGHEGAGVVEAAGPGTRRVSAGDHVAVSWIPSCGTCRWCIAGQGNLCDSGMNIATGELPNGGFRYFLDGKGVGGGVGLGTFSQWAVVDERSVVKVDSSIPLEWASLVSCGVATGWGSVVNAGKVGAGDVVVVYGCGGIGVNAVRAAIQSNAGMVAVVEPVAWKREFAEKSGADVAYPDAESAQTDLWDRTKGVGADVAVITVGKVDSQVIGAAFQVVRKGGTIVLTGLSDDVMEDTIQLPGSMLTLFQKRLVGSLYGNCTPHYDIPRLLDMAKAGKLELDDLVTNRYRLEDINQGYDDMLNGRNIRGVIVHEH